MKDYLNVWNWECTKNYYLKHPWKWFRELIWNMKSAHSRARKGYCYLDWANFDLWFKHIAPKMLRDMALYGHAYPGVEPFETSEKWNSWLHRMADQLTTCQDEDNGNEYYGKYMELLQKDWPQCLDNELPELKEVREKYIKRWEEIQEEHKKLFKETMLEMLEHWDYLWD